MVQGVTMAAVLAMVTVMQLVGVLLRGQARLVGIADRLPALKNFCAPKTLGFGKEALYERRAHSR
jgi:hypothetical protein